MTTPPSVDGDGCCYSVAIGQATVVTGRKDTMEDKTWMKVIEIIYNLDALYVAFASKQRRCGNPQCLDGVASYLC